jgi:DNA (cytosine-5)-methyltransferase 1
MTVTVAKNGASPNSFSVLPEKTFAEFFAGIGLMRIGLERQGWSIRYANDIDSEKYAMYKAHFPDADERFQLGDMHRRIGEHIPI